MPTTNLFVLSDLHLADLCTVLEGFQTQQQAALEGLLHAALPGGSLGSSLPPHLIINGDCFDFLAVPPYPADGISTPLIGLEKLEKIAVAHEPFFSTLRDFLRQGGRVTFLPGNHDIELCFAEVRARAAHLIDPTNIYKEHLFFCPDQRYRPVPDVLIEHGNQYDFWNYASGLWDDDGIALRLDPEQITLPLGTQYTHQASLPISLHYPYFERFAPPLDIARQIALLCLFNPGLVVQTAQGVARMISSTYQPLKDLSPGHEQVPADLFAHAMTDFVAFQQEMLARLPDWQSSIEHHLYTPDELLQRQTGTFSALVTLRETLEQGSETALRAIFAPPGDSDDEDTARGMQHVLHTHPELRVAVAGHTHITRAEHSAHGQAYLNTGTWIQRLAPPVDVELTPTVLNWLRAPDLAASPLTSKTAFVFARISTTPGQPSCAHLYTWEGDRDGHYHESLPEKE